MKRPVYEVHESQIISSIIPNHRDSYKPVENKRLIDLTLEGVNKAGFQVEKTEYKMNTNGMLSTGHYRIKNVNDPDMQLQIIWQNSYDKTASMKFAIGSHVFVCSNGSVSGDMGAFKKAHKGSIQEISPIMINDFISSAGKRFDKMILQKERMKQVQVEPGLIYEILGQLFFEEECINSLQLNIIKKEMKNPSFDYGCPNSVWEFYNHITHSLKESRPNLWLNDHIKCHDVITNLVFPTPQLDLFNKVDDSEILKVWNDAGIKLLEQENESIVDGVGQV